MPQTSAALREDGLSYSKVRAITRVATTGNETSLQNLVLLCRHHHLVHEGGFGLKLVPGGGFEFTDPNGKSIAPVPEARFSGSAFELMEANCENNITITPGTSVSDWGGEGTYVDIVVHHLLLRR